MMDIQLPELTKTVVIYDVAAVLRLVLSTVCFIFNIVFRKKK